MTARLALALACLGACSDLDPIDRGVCGNGVVEPGEDCDSGDPACEACGLRCETTDACVAGLGTGFVCGVDRFCHAPAGTFRTGGEVELPVASYRITDIDRDGVGDVLAQSPTTITVRYGDRDGTLATASSAISFANT